jgi:hypothetical protein
MPFMSYKLNLKFPPLLAGQTAQLELRDRGFSRWTVEGGIALEGEVSLFVIDSFVLKLTGSPQGAPIVLTLALSSSMENRGVSIAAKLPAGVPYWIGHATMQVGDADGKSGVLRSGSSKIAFPF